MTGSVLPAPWQRYDLQSVTKRGSLTRLNPLGRAAIGNVRCFVISQLEISRCWSPQTGIGFFNPG